MKTCTKFKGKQLLLLNYAYLHTHSSPQLENMPSIKQKKIYYYFVAASY